MGTLSDGGGGDRRGGAASRLGMAEISASGGDGVDPSGQRFGLGAYTVSGPSAGIDVASALADAVRRGTLLLAVPWVAAYLSCMARDQVGDAVRACDLGVARHCQELGC